MKKILITDTLFIFPKHEQKLRDAGFEFERLPKPNATEDELIEALKGKQGYILGGIEKVTDKVIESVDGLEAICFTGSDWRWFIPGYQKALNRGIKITNCPGANSGAVAEYAVTLMLAMTREIFDLGRTGNSVFKTTKSLIGSSVGIIGMGHIGQKVARILKSFGVATIYYSNRTRKPELEQELGLVYKELSEMIPLCDVITIHAAKDIGKIFGAHELKNMKDGSLLINCANEQLVDYEALYQELKSGRIRAAFDKLPSATEWIDLPLSNWFYSKESTAYNTEQANQLASDMATESIINLLSGKSDRYEVKEG